MPKSELISSVEKISERIARKVLKDCKFFGTMGTWIKTLQDENRTLKRRVEELEIRVKKLNDYGPTPVAGARKHAATGEAQSSSELAMKTPLRLTGAQMRKIRTARGFSQIQFAQLLGVSYFRYNKWELGKTAVPPDTERLIREIREMKAAAELIREFPDTHLLIIGDGPMYDELRRRIAGLGLTGHFHFAGLIAPDQVAPIWRRRICCGICRCARGCRARWCRRSQPGFRRSATGWTARRK